MTSATQNMHSACSHLKIVDDYLLKELKRGSIAGPFNALPSPSLHINRFGLTPRSEPNQWRMIIDLSFPAGAGVNDFIPDVEVSVKYTSVDDAIGFIIKCGRGALIVKFFKICLSHSSNSHEPTFPIWHALEKAIFH